MVQAEAIEPTISTHVLDAERGGPAIGIAVALYRLDGDEALLVGQATTDQDGRVRRLLSEDLRTGDYRLVFEVGQARRTDGAQGSNAEGSNAEGSNAEGSNAKPPPFFRRLSIDLHVGDPTRSYHVPLLLAPYSLTTYRGS